MSLIAALLPKSFLSWFEVEVKARAERLLGITDRQLDLAERELDARRKFVGLKVVKTKAIEGDE